jgi:heptosyltransferase-2
VSAPRRIVVRGPNWVGDAVMATPALRALRGAQPEAFIVLEGPAHHAALYRGLASFDAFRPAARSVRSLLARARELRLEGCDWALLLPDSPRAALAPRLAGTPRRTGYARDPLRRALLTQPLAPPRDARGGRRPISMVERYLALTRALGCPDRGDALELWVDPADRRAVDQRLAGLGVAPAEALLAVTPGAGFGSSKRWPPDHFAAACDGIAARHGARPVLAPGPGEAELAHRVAAAMETPAIVLDHPPLDLARLKALLERARLLLSNDTGPRHVAVALGCPVVSVLGPTDRRHSDHQLARQRVLREPVDCAPCHRPRCPIDHRCMTRVSPERAIAAADELLGPAP